MEQLIFNLRNQGRLDSTGKFTVDPVARDRKLGIDRQKRRKLWIQQLFEMLCWGLNMYVVGLKTLIAPEITYFD